MDSPAQRRLKILGYARTVEADADPGLVARLQRRAGRHRRAGGHDHAWGFAAICPQFITPRFTEADVARAVQPLRDRLASIGAERDALAARLAAIEGPPATS